MTCYDCSDLLLDYLYGLLAEDQAAALREHLAGCPACQAALAEARGQQNLFARAARKYRDVAPFRLPAEEAGPAPAPPLVALPSSVRTRRAAPRPRAPWHWRRWAAVGAAAALLVAVTATYAHYQTGLGQRQEALSKARKEVEQIDARFASFRGAFTKDAGALGERVQGQFLHIRVLGPATYYPGAPSVCRITTLAPDGKPAPCTVTVRLVVRPADQDDDQVLSAKEYPSTGEVRVVLPRFAIPAGAAVRLVVEASNSLAKEVVTQTLPVEAPTYRTHLTVNKSTLRPGDILFFRTATLERYGLTPIEAKVPMTFALLRAVAPGQVDVVKQLHGTTEVGGIAGGEFAITDQLPEGNYLLVASEAVPSGQEGHGIRTVTRPLLVVRDDPGKTLLTLDRKTYEAGQQINGVFRGLANAANQPVVIKTACENLTLGYLQLATDQFGNARFTIPTEPSMAPGDVEVELQLHDGVSNKKYRQMVPVVRPAFEAELYPEGGDLVADLPNRVFFRLHVPLWARHGIHCTLVDRHEQDIAQVPLPPPAEAGQPVLGSFTFTPRAGEPYFLRVVANRRQVQILGVPQVKESGVVLSAPAAVLAPTDPVRLNLWIKKKDTEPRNTDVLVLASCRGRVVDQKQLLVNEKFTEVTLEPAPGANGVLRVTVFEKPKYESDWKPVAERLLVRLPGEYLRLSAVPNKGTRRAYEPGEAAQLLLGARNEAGAPASPWLHVLVVDGRSQNAADLAEPGLPAYFLLGGELREPQDLEDADILLSDAPSAAQALELYLGTQGWRTFRETRDAPAALLRDCGAEDVAMAVPELFVGGTRRENVQDRYDRKLLQERESLRKDGERTVGTLALERESAVRAADRAADEIAEYQRMPLAYLRPAVGALVWLLIGAGTLLLVVGLVVAVRGRRSPRLYLVSAFCTLLLTLAVYALTAPLRTATETEGREAEQAARQGPDWSLPPQPPGVRLAGDALDRAEAGKMVVQLFARKETPHSEEEAKTPADLKLAFDDYRKPDGARPLAQTYHYTENAAKGQAYGSFFLQERFESAKELETMAQLQSGYGGNGGYGSGGGGPGTGLGKDKGSRDESKDTKDPGKGGHKGKTGKKDMPDAGQPGEKHGDGKVQVGVALLREYAHLHVTKALDYQDTVLWCPALLAEDGTARVAFELSGAETVYRVLVLGHTEDGRLGVFRGVIRVRR
jgi:hypothetical protein